MADPTRLSRFWHPFRTLGRRPPSLPPTQPPAKPPASRKSPSPSPSHSQKSPQPESSTRAPSPALSPSPSRKSPEQEESPSPEEPKKDLEDLEPKPIPTDPIGKQTIPEIEVEETKAEKTDIKLDELEPPKPPQPDDKKEENVEESTTKPEAKVETETRIEGVQEAEHKPKPETTMSEKLQIGTIQEREESIDPKRLDPEPPVPHPETSKLITKIRISKTKKRDDQDDAGGEELRRNGSDEKESKIKIASIPQASPPTGERTTFQAEIKEGISKLAEKLSIGHSELLGNGNGVMIVTLAGDNKGASMVIGYDSLTKDGSSHVHKEAEANKNSNKNRKEGSTDARDEIPVISARVNSNVQSINNSLLHESSCSEENPGVHLVFSSKPTMPVKTNGKPETIDTVKTIPKTAQAQKLTYTPRVRRRCLRGLLLEPSESDQEDPQKPQRHGCRVSCDGKKNMKAADIEDASTSIISWRKIT
ncbi:hypothetical protein J5N97_028003 [Dioscorea zingiberensis]|uniref:Uncharacterized protein n=1 Tax=Dioscorea zingiberensis TaxID=325984 RepID=A0A9D5H4I0_9LILI|nr:hypothetical protein J5N97_028003 [Dioscorea zingiberensis]